MNLTAKRSARLFFSGALIGLAVFLILYGFAPLNVSNDAFLRGGYVEQDIQQHYAGWMFYRSSPLSVPFCVAPNLGWPSGMSVAFTDSIPLFAVLFRLLSPLLPETFQYFGLFTLLCFLLQGGFAALLMGLFTEKEPLALLGTIPFVLSPILLERAFRHTSLAAHFLILAALYYYIRGRREGRFAYGGLFSVNCLTLAIHPYFVPMTFALTFALLLEHAAGHRQFLKPLGFLLANLAGCLGAGWLFGFFSAGGSASGGSGISYGYFSMNLNALWNPTSRGLVWSRFLPVQNQQPGNYDGFNYLGLGLLLALAAAVVFLFLKERRQILPLLRRHWGLLLVCLCLTVFAVSHIVTVNGAVLARLPLPQFIIRLATAFRSSGRLFWPVYYLLFLFALRGAFKIGGSFSKKQLTPALLSLILVVQIADLSPALLQKAHSLRSYQPLIADLVTGSTPALSSASSFFEAIRGRYQKMIALDPLTHTGLPLMLYAADEGMATTDTSILARYDEALAGQQQAQALDALLNGTPDTGSLYLTEQEAIFLKIAPAVQDTAFCAALQADLGSGDETVLYVIAPGFDGAGVTKALPFGENFPVHLADYSDDHWQNGVLSLNLEAIGRKKDQNKVILLPDVPYLRSRLEGARAVLAEETEYPILKVDTDPGWLMVTLDIPDAHILIEKDLDFVK